MELTETGRAEVHLKDVGFEISVKYLDADVEEVVE